jgi:dipeptidyl aminopeptidase/acylaminoacyl peptidase
MEKQTFKFPFIIGFAFVLFFSACSINSDSDPFFLPARDILDDSYGTDSRQKMDVYLPEGRSKSETPLFIYIHGGGWIDGDKSEFLQVKSSLEKEFPNYAFISLNYRLYDFATGRNGIQDQEQDIITAFTYIESKLSEWNISDDFIISGASAGGHLALLHAYKNNTSNLKAAVVFFPPTDLIELFPFNNFTSLGLTALLGGTPITARAAYLASSPINHVDSKDVPTIFFHGNQDTVVPISQSQLLEQKLKSEGVRYQFTIVQGQGHGFTPETYNTLLREVREFIGKF